MGVRNRGGAGAAQIVTDAMIGHCENKVGSCNRIAGIAAAQVDDRSIARGAAAVVE